MKNSFGSNFLVIKYKFKNDDKFCVQTVTKDVFTEMKNASQIEYCEIIN